MKDEPDSFSVEEELNALHCLHEMAPNFDQLANELTYGFIPL